jgi:SPP1 family predicted phage head-tail adaptor
MLGSAQFGAMDRPIRIQSYSETGDAATNQRTKTWTDLITMSAKRLPTRRSGNTETYQANQQVATEEYDFTIRTGGFAVNQKMRIYDIWESRYFYVTNIIRPGRTGTMTLTAEYRDND